jgi:hypothetical protein
MRTHLVITTALAIGLPALPAGSPLRVALSEASAPNLVLSRPGNVVVPRPGATVNKALARRNSPPAAAGAENSATTDASAHTALTLEARQLQGSEAISVTGKAPAGSQVTITLLATVSKDIPTIVVSRHDVVTDATGHFGAVIPIASAYERGTLLNVLATSVSGVAPAQAQLITGAPNEGVTVPLESESP